jgi:hypothetical protein
MYGEFACGESQTLPQIRLLYKNTLYRLEREKAVLLCMIKEYVKSGVGNFGEIPNLIRQNRKVDDIIVQEMHFRELLGTAEK